MSSKNLSAGGVAFLYLFLRDVYSVSKALCAMGLLGRGLVFFPTNGRGVSTMLLAHIKYRITHMLCPTLYAAIKNELIFSNAVFFFFFFLFFMCIAAYQL